MRRAAKIDANQPEIVQALRKAGASVQSLAGIGVGCPDLLVGFQGKTALVEIKDGQKVKSAQKLTADQTDWHASWRGGTLATVDGVDAALRVLKVMA